MLGWSAKPGTGGEGDFAASSFLFPADLPHLIDSNPGESHSAGLGTTNSKAHSMKSKCQNSNDRSMPNIGIPPREIATPFNKVKGSQ